MKICMIVKESIYDKKTWSGTPLTLLRYFQKQGNEVSGFAYDSIWNQPIFCLVRLIKKGIGTVFYQKKNLRECGWYHTNAFLLRKALRKYNADVYLFMGEHCLDRRISEKAKCYAYIDAALRPILELMQPPKYGVQHFLKTYEKNDKKSLQLLDGIFTQNEWSREYICKQYGIPEEKVINIGVGINVDFYDGEKNYENHMILIVLRPGTEYQKGLDLLLEAFKIAREIIPDLSLHVVGTDYKKSNGVVYYYNRPREVTISLFQKASLYAMPAIYEMNGITYLEALACKTPILGLERLAFPEFCGYGKYGFIVKQAEAECVAAQIVEAFSDTGRLESMGIEGQKYVKSRFRWSIVSEKMRSVLEKGMNYKGGT